MTGDALVLIGREVTNVRTTLETHADRLAARDVADAVEVLTYEAEPARELREDLRDVNADRTFVLPASVAHSRETTDALPKALAYLPGETVYCEPIGRSPAVTDLVARRGSELVAPGGDATLVLVGMGSSAQPYHRQTAEYHATRLREGTDYAEVVTCYLLQNPAVECARYNVSTERAVAVPLFLARNEATTERIPEKLDLARGGLEYAAPFGDDPGVTSAIHAEVEKQRVLADEGGRGEGAPTTSLARGRHPVATDGEGR
jgi:sirohydrochlorin ferrochelatase